MPSAPLPADERERLRNLRSYGLLDTPEEAGFDEIARIASLIFDTPIALVSLVDEGRQFFKARVGLEPRETDRSLAFCAHAILEHKTLVVEDALQDPRFQDNALVTQSPGIRFYAGAPLRSDEGYNLGTLCVLDTRPRSFSAQQQEILQAMASRVVAEMKLRRANTLLADRHDRTRALLNRLCDGVVGIDRAGNVSFMGKRAERLFGISREAWSGRSWIDVLALGTDATNAVQDLIAGSQREAVEIGVERIGCTMEVRKAIASDSPEEEIYLLFSDVTEMQRMREILDTEHLRHGIIGKSAAMRKVIELVDRFAPYDLPVLAVGETGTGKELVARAIHALSTRRNGPFVAINCGALSESLLSSQLFGHRRGAFTGAVEDMAGLFESADGGTVFLDEIGDMPMALQVSLLRVLEDKEVQRLGDARARPVDFRLISASNQNLVELIAAHRFREDLYYRLQGLELRLPALRDRPEDIPPLAHFFAQSEASLMKKQPPEFTRNMMASLVSYHWPGNVRELRNAVSLAVILSAGGTVRRRHLPPGLAAASAALACRSARITTDCRKDLLWALEQAAGNRSETARLLGISRATLYRRLKTMRINR
jgi:transcriptional regulator with PAS, ATPase and Fis domain